MPTDIDEAALREKAWVWATQFARGIVRGSLVAPAVNHAVVLGALTSARVALDAAHATEVAELRAEVERHYKDARMYEARAQRYSDMAENERGLRQELDGRWRKQWDDTVGKVARGEALLQPPPAIHLDVDASGRILAGHLKQRDAELAAVLADVARLTKEREAALANLDGLDKDYGVLFAERNTLAERCRALEEALGAIRWQSQGPRNASSSGIRERRPMNDPVLTQALASRDAELAALRGRLDGAEALLGRAVKYVSEDRAVTPGVTRLARLTDEVRAFLAGATPAPGAPVAPTGEPMGEVPSEAPPRETTEAREWSCQWTSNWSKLACPGLDGRTHNEYCDSLTRDVTRKLWARDRIAYVSRRPAPPVPVPTPAPEPTGATCQRCSKPTGGDWRYCLACLAIVSPPPSKEMLAALNPKAPTAALRAHDPTRVPCPRCRAAAPFWCKYISHEGESYAAVHLARCAPEAGPVGAPGVTPGEREGETAPLVITKINDDDFHPVTCVKCGHVGGLKVSLSELLMEMMQREERSGFGRGWKACTGWFVDGGQGLGPTEDVDELRRRATLTREGGEAEARRLEARATDILLEQAALASTPAVVTKEP